MCKATKTIHSVIKPESDVKILKGTDLFLEEDNGPYFYAFTPEVDMSIYTEVMANVKLPTELNCKSNWSTENKFAYISLGISGHGGWGDAADLGIGNDGTGWHPVFTDALIGATDHAFEFTAPDTATNAIIDIKAVSNSQVRLYVQFLDENGNPISIGGKDYFFRIYTVKYPPDKWRVYYHFASLLNVGYNHEDDQSYMLGGNFTSLLMFMKTGNEETDGSYIPWGIDSEKILNAWIDLYQKCGVDNFTPSSESFWIDYRKKK